MPVPVINFAALQPQGNPLLKDLIPSIQQGLELGYQPRMIKQDLQKQKLANALAQIQLQYAPQSEKAKASLLSQQAQYYGPETESGINARNASTDLNKAQLKYMPLEEMLKLYQAQQQTDRFGNAYQLNRALQSLAPASRALWISENSDQYTEMLKTMADNSTNNNKRTPYDDALNKVAKDVFPNMPLQLSGDDIQKLAQGGVGTVPQQSPQMMPQQQAGGFSPIPPGAFQGQQQQPSQMPPQQQPSYQMPPQQQPQTLPMNNPNSEALKKASLLSANNYLTTAATKNQLEGAVQVSSIMNDPGFQERAANAALYAGALGKGKEAITALSQTNPKAYEDFLTFKNADITLVKNRIKTLDKMGATDAQREELNGLFDKTMNSLTSNPQQFVIQLNNLGKAIDTVAKGVQKSAAPLGGVNRIEEYKPIKESEHSDEDLQFTANKHGISIEEVKKRLEEKKNKKKWNIGALFHVY